MKNSIRSLMPGIILIILGSLLLVHKLEIFYFDWSKTYPILFLCIGILFFISFKSNKNNNVIFWGTIFLLTGLLFLLRNYELIEYYYMDEIWPIFLIILGIAFFMLFVVNPRDWGVLIPSSILLFFGIINLLRKLHYWETLDAVKNYWPVIIIVIGGCIILGSLKKQTK